MSGKLVYDGFYKVWETEVEVKGEKRIYEKIDIKSAVAGILIDEDNKIALVTQFRPIIGRYTKEIPAGMIDKNLSARDILIEEFAEECELNKEDFLYLSERPVFSYFMLCGGSECKLDIYEGTVKRQENKKVNDSDVDSIEWVSLQQFGEYIKEDFIQDNKTLLTYYYLKDKINNKL